MIFMNDTVRSLNSYASKIKVHSVRIVRPKTGMYTPNGSEPMSVAMQYVTRVDGVQLPEETAAHLARMPTIKRIYRMTSRPIMMLKRVEVEVEVEVARANHIMNQEDHRGVSESPPGGC
jgi:hypothetical protein